MEVRLEIRRRGFTEIKGFVLVGLVTNNDPVT